MNTDRPSTAVHQRISRTATLVLPVALACVAACAATVPKELNDARAAYHDAAAGPAAQYNMAQLHTAEETLKQAESSFSDDGDSAGTRDRAYVAMRKSQLADVQGRTSETQAKLKVLQQEAEVAQVTQLQTMKGELVTAQQGQKEAEAKSAAAAAELSRLANVKQEERGMVITLSGSVLFASDKSELLPAAQQRLTEVAKALNEGNRDAQMVVEGHTDARGSEGHNLELSAQRAQAVRSYLVSQGIPESQIRSEGLGFSRPFADNKSAEGRANNRRVEIVVQPAGTGAKRVGT
jgi:outer membrane protein OmpA-like peptidoglycan-associated protein